MELERFRRLLETYGADFGRWPEEARTEARAILAVSAEALMAHREAIAVDQMLERGRGSISGKSVARVLDALAGPLPSQHPAGSSPSQAFLAQFAMSQPWAPTALLGAIAILGFVVGIVEPQFDQATDFVGAVFDSHFLGEMEL